MQTLTSSYDDRRIAQRPASEGQVGKVAVSRRFLAGMAFLTVAPLVGFPMMFGMVKAPVLPVPASVILVLLLVTGPIHVGSSAFFYVDRDFRALLRENRVR